jgi:hypothetical protein
MRPFKPCDGLATSDGIWRFFLSVPLQSAAGFLYRHLRMAQNPFGRSRSLWRETFDSAPKSWQLDENFQQQERSLAKPEWGAKRQCPKCGTRFYDLGNDDPITCISCGHEFHYEPLLKSRRPRDEAESSPAPVAKVRETEDDFEDDEDVDVDVEGEDDEEVLAIDDEDDEDDVSDVIATQVEDDD